MANPHTPKAIEVGEDMGIRTTRDEFKGSIILEFENCEPALGFKEKELHSAHLDQTNHRFVLHVHFRCGKA